MFIQGAHLRRPRPDPNMLVVPDPALEIRHRTAAYGQTLTDGVSPVTARSRFH